MNEMYNLSIVTHNYSVLVILAVISINLYKIFTAEQIQAYRRYYMLYNPMGIMVIASILFTGMIMMAAKHLDFSVANILMIAFGIVLIVLESKRSKKLKYLMNNDKDGFLAYKKFSIKVLVTEFILSLLLYIGMMI